MKGNRIYRLALAGIALLFLTACGRAEEASSSQNAISYGNSSNMKNGGLVEANEEGLFFVWEDTLFSLTQPGNEIRVLDAKGADSLCLTPDGLYYGSYDEQGNRGIYRMDSDGTNRSLLYQTDFTSLYAAGKDLLFLERGNIMAAAQDGSGQRLLYEGNYEALSVDGGRLYFKDRSTGNYYGRNLADEAGTLSDADILIQDIRNSTPVVSDGWIYYDSGQWMKTCRIKTDGSEAQQLAVSATELLARGAYSYAGNLLTDWESSETKEWSKNSAVRLIGFAGDWIVYEDYSYNTERLTDAVLVPQEVRLTAHDMTGTRKDIILRVKENADSVLSRETVRERFHQLLSGHRILLRNKAEGFFEALEREQDITWLTLDADGDRVEELFVRTAGYSYVFYASADGIYCWLAHPNDAELSVEPLSDGSFLYRTTYQTEGITQEMYDIYRFQPGGRTSRVNTFQHMKLDLEKLQVDTAVEAHVKENTYFAQTEFVTEDEWKKAVEEQVTALLIPEQEYNSYSTKAEAMVR